MAIPKAGPSVGNLRGSAYDPEPEMTPEQRRKMDKKIRKYQRRLDEMDLDRDRYSTPAPDESKAVASLRTTPRRLATRSGGR